MSISYAVDENALSRTLGYALDFRDTQTAIGGVMPVRIAVLTDVAQGTVATKTKLVRPTPDDVAAAFGDNALGVEIVKNLKSHSGVAYDVIVLTKNAAGSGYDFDKLEEDLGETWYTFVLNPFGADNDIWECLNRINGKPDELGGSGRWKAQKVKPFVAISGTDKTYELLDALILDGEDLTNVCAVAPNANNSDAEIATAYTILAANIANAKPYLDIAGKKLPLLKLKEGADIGKMINYPNRDALAKKGICTVTFDATLNGYVVQDFITFRNPPDQNELAKDWRFVRDIIVDMNVAYNYQLMQARTLMGKVIVADEEIIGGGAKADVIRLKEWKASVVGFFDRMIASALITDADYSLNSLMVELSTNNPKRINTQFAYKRTAAVGIASTTAYAGFSYGEGA